MEGRGVKRVHIQDGLQGWYRPRLRNRGKRGKMVVTEMAGGTGTIGMGEEMVVGIGGAIGLAAEGVGLVVEGFTVVEEEGIGIDRLSLWSFLFFGRLGVFASAAVGGKNEVWIICDDWLLHVTGICFLAKVFWEGTRYLWLFGVYTACFFLTSSTVIRTWEYPLRIQRKTELIWELTFTSFTATSDHP